MKTFDFILKHYKEAPDLMEDFKELVLDYILIAEDKENIEEAIHNVFWWEDCLAESYNFDDRVISSFIYIKQSKCLTL